MSDSFEAKCERIAQAREEAYGSLGKLESHVLTPPTFSYGAQWPNHRKAWRKIETEDTTIFASDGLSDPFEHNQEALGHGVEILVEAPGKHDPQGWLFNIIFEASDHCARYDHFGHWFDRFGLATFSIILGNNTPLPEKFHTPPHSFIGPTQKDTMSLFIGLKSKNILEQFETEDGPVKLITAKLLYPAELMSIFHEDIPTERKQTQDLAEKFYKEPRPHISDINRPQSPL